MIRWNTEIVLTFDILLMTCCRGNVGLRIKRLRFPNAFKNEFRKIVKRTKFLNILSEVHKIMRINQHVFAITFQIAVQSDKAADQHTDYTSQKNYEDK